MIHCTTATYRQPIHLSLRHSRSEPFMNGFFSSFTLYSRWKFILEVRNPFFALKCFNVQYLRIQYIFKKTPLRTISPQHYVCKIHVAKTICGEQGFIYLLGYEILYIYIILFKTLSNVN